MYNNWTRLDVRLEVQARMRDTGGRFWSDDRVNRVVRDGYREWCIATGACWHRDPLTLTAHEAVVNLPERLHKIDRVVYNDYRLDPLGGTSFQRTDRVLESEEGEPLGYIADGDSGDETEAPTDPYLKRLRFVRVPADNYDLFLEWTSIGDDLTSDSSVLWNVADHHILAIIYYAMWKLFSFEGQGQHVKFAAHFMQRYGDIVQRTVNRKSRSRTNRLMGMREGTPMRGGVRLARMPWNYGKVVR